jgi:hypothetical protein
MDVAEDLSIPPSNVTTNLKFGLKAQTIKIDAFVDEEGVVQAIQTPVGDRKIWLWKAAHVARVKDRLAARNLSQAYIGQGSTSNLT